MVEINTVTENNVVVYHNNLSELALKDFNAKERDLLMALCCRLKDCGTQEFSLTFREIRKLANYKQTSNRVLGEDLDSMTDKLFGLKMKVYGENGEINKFVFFSKFKIVPESGVLEVRTSEEFTYLINQLGANFTQFQLEEHTSLKSSYSKECYRQLMRYQDKGVWWLYADRFRELMDLPETYRDIDIKTKVLPRIEMELAPLFKSFEVSVEYRGKKPHKYTFRFNRFGETLPRDSDESTESDMACTESQQKEKAPQKEFNEEQFNAFWKAYPNKKGKGAARKKWERLKPDEVLFNTIMTALERQKNTEQWTKNNGQFIPHPTTWLNQERWEDEVKESPQQMSIEDTIRKARELREKGNN